MSSGSESAAQAPHPLRVLILRQGHYPQDPRVQREALALVAAGHSVEVLCLRDAGPAGAKQAARETVDAPSRLRD